jgi:hypothetical protein
LSRCPPPPLECVQIVAQARRADSKHKTNIGILKTEEEIHVTPMIKQKTLKKNKRTSPQIGHQKFIHVTHV